MDNQQNIPYDYAAAGFDKFFNRSVDGSPQTNLDGPTIASTAIPFDRGQQSGSFGNAVRIGNVQIDGVRGRISVYDDSGNEVIRIGELDG